MKCLLCGKSLQTEITFTNLLCFKKEEELVCESCISSFESIGGNHCPSCFKKGLSTICQDCQFWCKKGVKVDHVALYSYNQAMKEYFSRYKFMGDYCLRKIFQQEIKANLKPFLKKGYILVPVPLSEERLEDRGFNQVKGLLEGIPYKNIFEKRDIEKQSSRTREERLSQDNPFSLKKGIELPSKIIIVDDIYTTGSTLYQMVKLLDDLDVKEVLTFSLAR